MFETTNQIIRKCSAHGTKKKMYCHVRRMNGSKATFLCESDASRTFLSPKRLPKGCNVGITQFHEQSPKPCMLYVWCILGIYGPAFKPLPPGHGHGSAIVLCLPSPLVVWSGCGSVPLPSLWCGGGVVLPPLPPVVWWGCGTAHIYIYNIYICICICMYIYICIWKYVYIYMCI